MNKKLNNRRYYLHRVVKSQGFNLYPKERMFRVPYNYDISKFSKHAKELVNRFHYPIQKIIE